MTRYFTFYSHYKHPSLFKRLLVDTKMLDNKLGFPQSQIADINLVSLYHRTIDAKRAYKAGLISFNDWLAKKDEYLETIAEYHKPRR